MRQAGRAAARTTRPTSHDGSAGGARHGSRAARATHRCTTSGCGSSLAACLQGGERQQWQQWQSGYDGTGEGSCDSPEPSPAGPPAGGAPVCAATIFFRSPIVSSSLHLTRICGRRRRGGGGSVLGAAQAAPRRRLPGAGGRPHLLAQAVVQDDLDHGCTWGRRPPRCTRCALAESCLQAVRQHWSWPRTSGRLQAAAGGAAAVPGSAGAGLGSAAVTVGASPSTSAPQSARQVECLPVLSRRRPCSTAGPVIEVRVAGESLHALTGGRLPLAWP